MIKLRAIIRILFAKRFFVASCSGDDITISWKNLQIRHAEAIAQYTEGLKQGAINEHRAVEEAKKIIAGDK